MPRFIFLPDCCRFTSRIAFSCALAVTLIVAPHPQAFAQAHASSDLTGCVAGNTGNFTLAIPSGEVYRIQGKTALLKGYANHMVRITGVRTAPARMGSQGAITMKSVQAIADTCTMPAPPPGTRAQQPVTGQTAAGADEINVSRSGSVGQNTPGANTQSSVPSQSGARPSPPLAPPNWGEVGQAPQTGNTDAASTQRTEEQPGKTLGVNSMPSYANPNQPQGQPATQGGSGVGAEKGQQPTGTQSNQNQTAPAPPNSNPRSPQ